MARNMLVDGVWWTDVEPYTDQRGAFDRVETSFRDPIHDAPCDRFQPAADRYQGRYYDEGWQGRKIN